MIWIILIVLSIIGLAIPFKNKNVNGFIGVTSLTILIISIILFIVILGNGVSLS